MEVSKFKTLLGLTIVLPSKFGKIWSDKYSTLRRYILVNTGVSATGQQMVFSGILKSRFFDYVKYFLIFQFFTVKLLIIRNLLKSFLAVYETRTQDVAYENMRICMIIVVAKRCLCKPTYI